jgi:hypothetical protein
MNNSNWRIPDEKERKIALYWIKRNSWTKKALVFIPKNM